MELISRATATATERFPQFMDLEQHPIDAQWAALGEAYLLFLHAYDPANDLVQLENLQKFFTYHNPLFALCPRG